jgi:DNA primase
MQFANEFLDEIRIRLPLVQVVGKRVRLSKRGQEYTGLCPFHNEKTPSFTVNEEKGFFHCFGCGVHGDVIAFVMRDEGLSFPDAVKNLAGEAGLKIPLVSATERQKQKQQDSLYPIIEVACKWFEVQLASNIGQTARSYLARRGFKNDVIKTFRLGYAPEERDSLKKELEKKGISESLSLAAGLLTKSSNGDNTFDKFRNRIIFPISDRRGRLVGFGGRSLGDIQPKYLNSPETQIFHKGFLLYGLNIAQKTARNNGNLIIVEGYTDVISLNQAGITEVAAPLGTALTEVQLEELWRIVDEPILCFDGDQAGQRAASRALDRALAQLKAGKSLRFITLADGEDPDSLIQSVGSQSFRSLISGSEPLSTMLWRVAGGEENLDTPESQLSVSKKIDALLLRLRDDDTRKFFRKYYREKLFSWRSQTDNSKPSRDSHNERSQGRYSDFRGFKAISRSIPVSASLSSKADSAVGRQKSLLRVFITFPFLAEEFHEELERFPFSIPKYCHMRDTIINAIQNVAKEDFDSEEKAQKLAKSALTREIKAENLHEFFSELNEDSTLGFNYENILSDSESIDQHEKARLQIRHLFDLHHRLVGLEVFKKEATEAFAANMSEENWDKLVGALSSLQEAPGIEEQLLEKNKNKKNIKE